MTQNEKKEDEKLIKKETKYTPNLTDSKIKKLLDFQHLEELYHLLNSLDEKQVKTFLTHYKDSDIKHTKDVKLERVMKSSETAHQLIENVKSELAKTLTDEYLKIRDQISTLRKKGSDLYIEDIKSMSTPSKIKMFKSTGLKDDFYKVKKSLHELSEEVEKTIKTIEEKNQKDLDKKEQDIKNKPPANKTNQKNPDSSKKEGEKK